MLTIPTKRLAEAVKACGALATSKHIPILACARIEASGGVMTLTANDLDMQITYTIPDADGDLAATCVDAQKLRDAATRIGAGGDLKFSLGETLSIKGDGGSARLPTLSALEYPSFGAVEDPEIVARVSGGMLTSALAAVAPAMSTEQTRYYLCGVALWRDSEGLRLGASDGRQLIFARLSDAAIDAGCHGVDGGVIIPSATVKMLPDAIGEVAIRANAQRIEIAEGRWTVLSRLIDKRPLDSLDRVTPERGACWADVDAAELVAAVERVAWAADGRQPNICMTLREGEIQVDAWDGHGRAATSAVPADVRLDGGPPMEIGLFAHVLLPVVRGMGSEVVGLSWAKGNAVAPVRIDAVGPKDGQRWGVAMPCRMSKPQEMKHAA